MSVALERQVGIDVIGPVPMETVVANSFRDYHVKGFDYVCLKRSPTETVKLYFFDGDVSKLPEVVNPHDHRYDFRTIVVAGQSQNVWYREASPRESAKGQGEFFERFAYDTPLLGGGGFVHVGQTRLVESQRGSYDAFQKYNMRYSEIHTIRMMKDRSVLCLVQREDRVTDRPTLTFVRGQKAPTLTGLYNRFTPDAIGDRMSQLAELAPGIHLPKIV